MYTSILTPFERLQRQAARVVCKKYKNDHTSVTELMWGLHWLPIRARIQYKILLLVYKAFTNGSPTYLADMMTSCNPVRSTRSSHKVNLLVVPHQKSNKYSEKAFAVVGPQDTCYHFPLKTRVIISHSRHVLSLTKRHPI